MSTAHGQPAGSVPAHFFPPNMADPPDYGPNDAFNYQHRPWPMQPYMQHTRQTQGRIPPPPPNVGAPSPPPPGHRPVPAKPINPFQATTHTGPGGIAMCRPTPAMPRLCDISGGNFDSLNIGGFRELS